MLASSHWLSCSVSATSPVQKAVKIRKTTHTSAFMRTLPSVDGTVHPGIGLPNRACKFSWAFFLQVVQSDVKITPLGHLENKTMVDK
jgi:hypothetical protein